MKNGRKMQSIVIIMLICIVFTSVFANPMTILAAPVVSENDVPKSERAAEAEDVVSENDVETAFVGVGQVTQVSVESTSYRALQISYKAVYGAKGYEIYRGETSDNMQLIADLSAVRTSYADQGDENAKLVTNKNYFYKVRAYCVDESGQKIYGEFSTIVSGKPQLNAPVITAAETVNYKTVKLTYGKVDGANGYVIYRSTKENGGFKKIATIKKKKTVEYTDKACKTGITYYYKVRAYRKVNGKKKYSPYSEAISAVTKLKKPKLKSVTVTSGDTALVVWKKVSGASGYYIYRCDKSNGKFKRVAKVKGGTTVQTYVSGQENGKTYYYKVRAYRTVDKKKKFSDYSNMKSALFNLLASSEENYQDKAQRIFGLPYYKKYSSKEEADQYMVSITIDVWDFAADGVTKVPKKRTLVVHKNIAATVQQIFKEIYEGEEKFPIKNVGGYSWRGESSNSEHCCGVAIDINWEENYLIDNGVIISGKLYQPGVNPYSIPTDGEVAKIMNKYGFRQGIWGNRCDYMHFSYFGT